VEFVRELKCWCQFLFPLVDLVAVSVVAVVAGLVGMVVAAVVVVEEVDGVAVAVGVAADRMVDRLMLVDCSCWVFPFLHRYHLCKAASAVQVAQDDRLVQ
jgi:hypothetical protein